MSRRKYSDREKAMFLLALEANAGNLSRTFRETGVPIKTLADWRDEISGINADVAIIRNETRPRLIDELRRLAETAISAAFSKIGEATFSQTMTGAGIAIDKMQLLSGKATVIVDDLTRLHQLAAYMLQKKLESGLTEEQAVQEMRFAAMNPEDITWAASLTPEQREQQVQEFGRVD